MDYSAKIKELTECKCEQKTIFSPHAKNSDELIKEFTNALILCNMDSEKKGESK